MVQNHSLFVELEATLSHGSGPQRFTILRRMTDLFLAGSESYTDEHIAVFDQLMSRLIEKIERQALIELSGKLAPVDRAPVNVIGRLSRDDDIQVSGPILEQSNMLTDSDLVEIAQTKSQAHLSAIAGRSRVGEPVTDVLIDRGNSEVAQKVTTNKGARFSRFGFDKALTRAKDDESLAMAVASRVDLPPEMLDRLIEKATSAIRERLLANAKPEMQARITQALAKVAGEVTRSAASSGARAGGRSAPKQDPARVKARISQCVEARNADGLIEALAVLSQVPVKAINDLIQQGSDEGMIVLGRACGLGWPEMQNILSVTMPAKTKSPEAIKTMFAKFINLTAPNAERAIKFIRTSASKSADESTLQLLCGLGK